MKLKVIIFVFFLFSTYEGLLSQTVSLNEVMSSNSEAIADDDGDYEDWIELYNYGNEVVNLDGFYLSDDYNEPYMWQFPEVKINPGEHLVVWASGKDHRYSTIPLHTNFKVSMSGEEVLLSNSEGERIDELAPTPIPTNMSYGRHPDGTGTWHYLETPMPGKSNSNHIDDTQLLMHYWFFDTDIPNNTPLESIAPYYSLVCGAEIEYFSSLAGYPFDEEHPNWRKASMERRNEPTMINYSEQGNRNTSYFDTNIRGLQVRQPFENFGMENKMVFYMPTNGFEDVILRFAAKDEGAVDNIFIEYSVESDKPIWLTTDLETPALSLSDNYQLFEIDFRDIAEANNNNNFKIRMSFGGNNLDEDNGNRVTFNNITLDGTPVKSYYINSQSGSNGMIHPEGFNRVYSGESFTFKIFPTQNYLIDQFFVDETLTTEDLNILEDNSAVFEFNKVNDNHIIYSTFSLNPQYVKEQEDQVLVYPNPASNEIRIASHNSFNRMKITDLQGRSVYNKEINSYTDEVLLDISILNNGVYILLIYTEDNIVSKKIKVTKFSSR